MERDVGVRREAAAAGRVSSCSRSYLPFPPAAEGMSPHLPPPQPACASVPPALSDASSPRQALTVAGVSRNAFLTHCTNSRIGIHALRDLTNRHSRTTRPHKSARHPRVASPAASRSRCQCQWQGCCVLRADIGSHG
eukprot:6183645-Pleurochrysis_carterae.AAC.1